MAEPKAILKIQTNEPVFSPSGQPIGQRQSEALIVLELDVSLREVMRLVKSKNNYVVTVLFETDIYDPGMA
jgi:hypothetical protein